MIVVLSHPHHHPAFLLLQIYLTSSFSIFSFHQFTVDHIIARIKNQTEIVMKNDELTDAELMIIIEQVLDHNTVSSTLSQLIIFPRKPIVFIFTPKSTYSKFLQTFESIE